MPIFLRNHVFVQRGFVCVLLCSLVGCATAPKEKKSSPIFFPAAPQQPRLQFLTSFSGSEDFERENGFLTFLLGKSPPEKTLIKPYGVSIGNGKMFVCDTVARVIYVFDLRERKIDYFIPKGPGKLSKPINLAVDQDGTRYVADAGRGQIVIFDAEGNYLSALGGAKEMKPTDIVVRPDRLYVTDLVHKRVMVYDKTSRDLILTVPRDEDDKEKQLYSPVNLTVDSKNHLLVSDIGSFRIQVYDENGNYVRSVGRPGTAAGEFVRPKGVAVDKEDRLYVVDAATQVVQLFNKEGQLLLFFGQPDGRDSSLVLPADVWVDYDHVAHFQDLVASNFQLEYLVFVSSQYGNRKISVFGFGNAN